MASEIELRSQAAIAVQNILNEYTNALGDLLPRTGVKPASFIGFAKLAIERDTRLAEVSAQNPGSLMTALMKCAMLGHLPGSKEFELVAYGGKNPSVSGIEQYHGLLVRAQRAAPGIVIADAIVRKNDVFRQEERLGLPVTHEFDPFATSAERGNMRGVYAQALLPQGVYTKSVILGPEQIAKYKEMSRKEKFGEYAGKSRFWTLWPEEMARKTAILRLRLPTSAEWQERMGGLVVAAQRVSQATGAAMPDLDSEDFTEDDAVVDVEP